MSCFAVAFGTVHRVIGCFEEISCSLVSGHADRDADARRRACQVPSESHRPPDSIRNSPRDRLDFTCVLHIVEQHGEFVAPDTRDNIAASDAAPEPFPDRDKQAVTRGVTKVIVDLLEVIEVDEEDRYGRIVFPGSIESRVEPVGEVGPIW
jgi:hypothetical protein